MVRYFEWMGAAVHTADHRASAMHGKQFLVDCVYTGIDETHVYGRLDFVGKPPEADCRPGGQSRIVGSGGEAAPTSATIGRASREPRKSHRGG